MPDALLSDFNEHFKLREADYRQAQDTIGTGSTKEKAIIELPPNVCFLKPTFENLLAANGIMNAVLGKRDSKVTIYSKYAVSTLYQIWVNWNKNT